MSAPLAPPVNTQNVIVGPAAVYLAPKYTPLPADSSVLFDPTNWTGKVVNANGATALTLSVTTVAGTQSTASLTTFGTITAAAVATALAGLSNVGAGNVVVTGAAGGPFTVVFANSLGSVTLAITAQTGGTGATVTGGLWTPVGATDAGWTFGAAKTTQDINIEEQSTPVGRFITNQSVSIAASLAEDSVANWSFALNAVKTLIAAGAPSSGQPGVAVLTLSDVLQHYAVALEALNEYGYATRSYIPDSETSENLSTTYRRAAEKRMLNVAFNSVCPTNQIVRRAVMTATP